MVFENKIDEFTENYYSNDLLRNRMANELLHEIVPVILHEDDLNSMFYSIENRFFWIVTFLIYVKKFQLNI